MQIINIKDKYIPLLLIFVAFMTNMFWAWKRSLYITYEAIYATTIYNMARARDYILPVYNGEVNFHKPPLFYWLTVPIHNLFGDIEFTYYFWPGIFGILTALLVYYIGKEMFNKRTGFYASLILSTTFFYFISSRTVNMDNLLTFNIALALFCFYLGCEKKKRICYLAIYPLLAIETLNKGPLALILCGLIILIYLFMTKKIGEIKNMFLPSGICMFLLIVVPWYYAVFVRTGGKHFFQFIIYHNLARFLSTSMELPPRPFYYYLLMWPLIAFPWGTFMLYPLYDRFKKKTYLTDNGSLLLVIWFLVVFVFFSLSKMKAEMYLLPLLPAASLLLACFWANGTKDPSPTPKIVHVTAWGIFLLFALLMTALPFLAKFLLPKDLSSNALVFWPIGISTGILSVIALYSFFVKKKLISFYCLFGTGFLLAIFLSVLVFPAAEKFYPWKDIAGTINKYDNNAKYVFVFRADPNYLAYYTKKIVRWDTNEQMLKKAIDSSQYSFFVTPRSQKNVIDKYKALKPYALLKDHYIYIPRR